jgi:hypothetical protein
MAFIFKDASGYLVKLITPGDLVQSLEIDVTLIKSSKEKLENFYTDDLRDVDTLNYPPHKGDVLRWDGSNWISQRGYTFYEFNTTASDGQNDFELYDDETGDPIKADKIRVYRDGVKVRDSEYSINENGDHSVLHLNQAASEDEWISAEIVRLVEQN